MSNDKTFLSRLEIKVMQQLGSQKIGYVLGAGASYLDGRGYPLANQIWENIANKISEPERGEIQDKIDSGADGIEKALDLIDNGEVSEKTHRYLVMEAIAEYFYSVSAPLNYHQSFVRRLAQRNELSVPIFCLNYDGLIELASDAECVRVVDGFSGLERPYFCSQTFQESYAIRYRGKLRPQADWCKGVLHLYKLHGSLGWFQDSDNEIRKLGINTSTPSGMKRLMVPPQYRKAIDTTAHPYSALWSDFRGLLCHGPILLHRIVTIGYGLRDEHLNSVIENALARNNFTLLVFAQILSDDVFNRWSAKRNTIIVTNSKCSMNGDIGPGHPDMWNFATLCERI